MKYSPREYWPARLAEQGSKFVGRAGMDDKGVDKQAEQFLLHILPHIPDECESLLDFGCGVGRLAPHLSLVTKQYRGFDTCREAILLAPDLDPGCYVWNKDDYLPFEPDNGEYPVSFN